jgi:hypothetical protein
MAKKKKGSKKVRVKDLSAEKGAKAVKGGSVRRISAQ